MKEDKANSKKSIVKEESAKRSLNSQEITIRPYLEKNFQETLDEGLRQLLKNKPDDPIKFLGNFLLERAKK